MTIDETTDRDAAGHIVSKALLRAARDLSLNGIALSQIIGLSTATISRVRSGTYKIAPGSKSYEMALMVVRIHKALMVIMDGDILAAREWMKTPAPELKIEPREKMKDIRGLVSVMVYTEMRKARAEPVTVEEALIEAEPEISDIESEISAQSA